MNFQEDVPKNGEEPKRNVFRPDLIDYQKFHEIRFISIHIVF